MKMEHNTYVFVKIKDPLYTPPFAIGQWDGRVKRFWINHINRGTTWLKEEEVEVLGELET